MGKKDKLPLPERPLDKLLAHLDAKTIALLLAMLGSNGAWIAKILNEDPAIPVAQSTLTQERAAAEIERDKAVTAKEACQDALLKKQTRGGRRP